MDPRFWEPAPEFSGLPDDVDPEPWTGDDSESEDDGAFSASEDDGAFSASDPTDRGAPGEAGESTGSEDEEGICPLVSDLESRRTEVKAAAAGYGSTLTDEVALGAAAFFEAGDRKSLEEHFQECVLEPFSR